MIAVLPAAICSKAVAQGCTPTSFPYTLTDGTTADASQVMADLNCAPIVGLANWGGNVGIGTTTPSSALQVAGTVTDTGEVVNGTVTDNAEQINGGSLTFSAANPAINTGGSYIIIPNGIFVLGGTPYFQTQAIFRGGIYDDEAAYLTINGGTSGHTYFTGNVGIGTTSPASALSIAGNSYTGTSIQFYNSSSAHTFTLGDKVGSLPVSTMELDDNGTAIVDFQAGGNVGIGTTAPGSTLEVSGSSAAASVTANAGVFQIDMSTTTALAIGSDPSPPYEIWMQTKRTDNDGSMFDLAINPLGGNVGIGTTTPSSMPQVAGTVTDNGEIVNGTVTDNAEQINGGSLNFSAINPTISTGGSYITFPSGIYVLGGTPYFQTQAIFRGGIYDDEAAYLTINGGTTGHTYFTGNVGIGTTSPVSALSLIGNSYTGTSIQFDNTSGTYTFTFGDKIGSLSVSTMELDDNGTAIMDFQAGGNVGIGTTVPGAPLDVRAASDATLAAQIGGLTTPRIQMYGDSGAGVGSQINFNTGNGGSLTTGNGSGAPIRISPGGTVAAYFAYDGYVGIDTTSPSYPLYVNGQAGGTTSWTNTSDGRLKKNIVEITGALQLVQKLRGVRFDWKRPEEREVGKTLKLPKGEHEMGFIAQEVAEVVPEAVATPKAGKDGLYGLKEADLVPLLVEAIKEQQKSLKEQKVEIAKLQSSFDALKRKLSRRKH